MDPEAKAAWEMARQAAQEEHAEQLLSICVELYEASGEGDLAGMENRCHWLNIGST